MITGWRLIVYDRADPTLARSVLDPTDAVLSIDYASLRGDGACRELALTAKAGATGIRARDHVTLYPEVDGSLGSPIWYGIVTMPGAQRGPEATTIRAVGAGRRVHEVDTGADTYAQQDVAAIVRDLLQTYLPDGVDYSAGLAPDLGVQVAFDTRYNLLGTCLDELAQVAPGFVATSTYTYDGVTYDPGDYVPPVTWGVGPDRRLFFRRWSPTVDALQEGVDVDQVDSISVDAEDICTRVVFLASSPLGTLLHAYDDAAAQAEYGVATKYAAVPTVDAPLAGGSVDGYSAVERSSNGGTSWSAGTTASYWTDEDTQTGMRDYATSGIGTGFFWAGLGWTWPSVQGISRVYVDFEDESPDVVSVALALQKSGTVVDVVYDFGTPRFRGEVELNIETDALYLVALRPSSGSARDLRVWEFRVDEPAFEDVAALDRAGAALVDTPAVEAAEVTRYGLLQPAPRVDVTLQDATALPTLDVRDVEYRVTREDGLATRLRLGIADTADEVAQSTLIRAISDRAQRSTIDLLAAKKV